jgi:hypothetical protein
VDLRTTRVSRQLQNNVKAEHYMSLAEQRQVIMKSDEMKRFMKGEEEDQSD